MYLTLTKKNKKHRTENCSFLALHLERLFYLTFLFCHLSDCSTR